MQIGDSAESMPMSLKETPGRPKFPCSPSGADAARRRPWGRSTTDATQMSLEARVPPPVITVVAGVIMWGISRFAPQVAMPSGIRLGLSIAILVVGIGFSAAGILSFRRARTTLKPTKPERASSLVHTGIYRVTRNPMYLGLLFVLCAWAVFLSSGWALLGAAGFVLYMNRFQIAPEERALSALFGSEYASYKASVRRWL